MIRPTTLNGTKDILLQYGSKYCIIYYMYGHKEGYYLVEIADMENCMSKNSKALNKKPPYKCTCTPDHICNHCKWYYYDNDEYTTVFVPEVIAEIDEFIMLQLIDDGFVIKSMSDKEYQVQNALGTAPDYRPYLIAKEVV